MLRRNVGPSPLSFYYLSTKRTPPKAHASLARSALQPFTINILSDRLYALFVELRQRFLIKGAHYNTFPFGPLPPPPSHPRPYAILRANRPWPEAHQFRRVHRHSISIPALEVTVGFVAQTIVGRSETLTPRDFRFHSPRNHYPRTITPLRRQSDGYIQRRRSEGHHFLWMEDAIQLRLVQRRRRELAGN